MPAHEVRMRVERRLEEDTAEDLGRIALESSGRIGSEVDHTEIGGAVGG